MAYTKIKKIITEKTKTIWELENKPHAVIIEKHQNKTQTLDKAELITTVTCAVFELCKQYKIPTAYTIRYSPTEFIAQKCIIIPLEIVGRRYATGNYLKRMPIFKLTSPDEPFYFPEWKFELFIKTNNGLIRSITGEPIAKTPPDPLRNYSAPVEHPFIPFPCEKYWKLQHPELPTTDHSSILGIIVDSRRIIGRHISALDIKNLAEKIANAVETIFARLGVKLIDFKIEFGINSVGKLVLTDAIIDNDNWNVECNSNTINITKNHALVAGLL